MLKLLILLKLFKNKYFYLLILALFLMIPLIFNIVFNYIKICTIIPSFNPTYLTSNFTIHRCF